MPHPVIGRFGAGRVLLKPAPEGTGIIAGGAVRAVVESAGVSNVLTKSLGTANPHNVVRAAFTALQQLKDPAVVARLRGKDAEEAFGARGRRTTIMAEQAKKKLKITLVRSPIGFNRTQAATVQGMGLRKIRHTVELADTPETRGMIHKVRHLVEVVE